MAREIGLGEHVLLGRGEAAAEGAEKPSILSDAFEAMLGAVYLDGGSEAAYGMVERLVARASPRRHEALDQLDHKTQLQELAARPGRGAPVYTVDSTGPDHAKTFVAAVFVDGRAARARGRAIEEGRPNRPRRERPPAPCCD